MTQQPEDNPIEDKLANINPTNIAAPELKPAEPNNKEEKKTEPVNNNANQPKKTGKSQEEQDKLNKLKEASGDAYKDLMDILKMADKMGQYIIEAGSTAASWAQNKMSSMGNTQKPGISPEATESETGKKDPINEVGIELTEEIKRKSKTP